MGNFKLALEAATDHLKSVLPSYGFPSDPVLHKGAAYRRIWTKDSGWKQETVEIVYRRGGELRVHVNLGVFLPIPERHEPALFDGIGLSTPRIPASGWRWVMLRHNRKVAAIIDASMDWFVAFSTPDRCISAFELPTRNGSTAPEALERFRRYLEPLSCAGEGG